MTDSTSEMVILNHGYVIPLPALELALALERRDLRLLVRETAEGTSLRVSNSDGSVPTLSEAECAAIRKWKGHLLGLIAYVEAESRPQPRAQPAQPAQRRLPRRQ